MPVTGKSTLQNLLKNGLNNQSTKRTIINLVITSKIYDMGRIIHFEIPSDNVDRSLEFYRKTFGWTISRWGEEDYWMAETGDKESPGINGAITKRDGNFQHVVNTIKVENINEAITMINSNGGKVLSEIVDIPQVGKYVYFKDPDDNTLCVMETGM
jgi:uncharacterized protein